MPIDNPLSSRAPLHPACDFSDLARDDLLAVLGVAATQLAALLSQGSEGCWTKEKDWLGLRRDAGLAVRDEGSWLWVPAATGAASVTPPLVPPPLSNDVLAEICAHCDTPSLMQLCESSPRLLELASPVLYESLDLASPQKSYALTKPWLRSARLASLLPRCSLDRVTTLKVRSGLLGPGSTDVYNSRHQYLNYASLHLPSLRTIHLISSGSEPLMQCMPLATNLNPRHLILEYVKREELCLSETLPNPLAWQTIYRLWSALSSMTVIGTTSHCAEIMGPNLLPPERWHGMRLTWDLAHLGDEFQGTNDDPDTPWYWRPEDDANSWNVHRWLESFDVWSGTFPSAGVTLLVCNDLAQSRLRNVLDVALAEMAQNGSRSAAMFELTGRKELKSHFFHVRVKGAQRNFDDAT